MPLTPPPEPQDTHVSFAKTDFVQPFLIDHSSIRGRLTRLEKTLDSILSAHNYPRPVSEHLAEQVVLAALLSATLSGHGVLTLQAKGEGPVRYMVVDVLADGAIRGYARVDQERLAELGDESLPLSRVLGKGYLAVTLEQGDDNERYQGIVALEGSSLSEALSGYLIQSQQVEVSLHVAVNAPAGKRKKWTGGGIIVERIPLQGGKESAATHEEQEELWSRTTMFMKTLSDREMLDPEVTPQNLLYRLFNEDGVWVYKLQLLKAGCRCSRVRMKNALKSIPLEDVLTMLDAAGKLVMSCEFCNKKTAFTEDAVRKLYVQPKRAKKSK